MSFTIPQNLFINDSTVITVVKCNDDAVTVQHIEPLLLDAIDRVLGVSATYGKACQLSSIAFSTLSRVLVVNIPARHTPQLKHANQQRVTRSRTLIQDRLLLNPNLRKHAFKMDQLAVALYLDLSIRINDAVDMLSVTTNDSRQSLQALMNAMGGELNLQRKNVQSLFFDTSKSTTMDAAARVALEAWGACRAATLPHMSPRFAPLPSIDTLAFPKAVWSLVHLCIALLTCCKI